MTPLVDVHRAPVPGAAGPTVARVSQLARPARLRRQRLGATRHAERRRHGRRRHFRRRRTRRGVR